MENPAMFHWTLFFKVSQVQTCAKWAKITHVFRKCSTTESSGSVCNNFLDCESYYFHLLLPEPSGPPLSPSADALGPTSLQVRWEPPNCVHLNSQRATSYIIQHGPAGASQLEETSVTSGLSRVLDTLPTFTVYSVRVLAVNEEGRGPPSVMVEVELVDGESLLVFKCQ